MDVIISTWGVTASESYVSPERLAELETIIYEKIRQKTFTKEDEGKTVKKAFQYFDLEGKGVVDIKQFSSALRKFGCVFSEVEIFALFTKYDTDQSSKLAYDEFCAIFALKGAGVNPNVNPVFKLSREPPLEIIAKIRNGLMSKGAIHEEKRSKGAIHEEKRSKGTIHDQNQSKGTIHDQNQSKGTIHDQTQSKGVTFDGVKKLGKLFKKTDKNKSGSLCRSEFCWVLKEVGVQLTKNEFDNIFRFFDKNCDDEISYKEFIGFVRGELNERRLNIVREAFGKLDKGRDGKISLNEIKAIYDTSMHPQVKLEDF